MIILQVHNIAAFPLLLFTCTQPRTLIFHCCLQDIRGLILNLIPILIPDDTMHTCNQDCIQYKCCAILNRPH